MTDHYQRDIDPELVPEFIPTEVRFSSISDAKSLRDLLGRITRISGTSSVAPGSDLVKITAHEGEDNKAGFMKLSTTNGSIFITNKFIETQVLRGGTVYVPAKKLSDVLKRVDGELVTCTCTGFEFQVSSESSLWRIQLPRDQAQQEFQLPSEFEKARVDAQEFRSSLVGVQKAVAKEYARASLTQALFTEGKVLSCDGSRLHRALNADFKDFNDFTLSGEGITHFLSSLDNTVVDKVLVVVSDVSVTMTTGLETVTALRKQVAFPEVEKVFITQNVLNDTSVAVPREPLLKAVKDVRLFADDVLSAVELTQSGESGLFVHASDGVGNASQTTLKVSIKGSDKVNLKLNYRNLIDVLDSVQSEFITLQVGKNTKTHKTSVIIEDVDSGFTAVLGQLVKD